MSLAELQKTETVEFARPDPAVVRRDLDEKGLATLEDFFTPEEHGVFVEDALAAVAGARPSNNGYKYSLKDGEIEGHALCRFAKSTAFIGFLQSILQREPAVEPRPLGPENIRIGYSILKEAGDKVFYHFDSLNHLNVIVPIVLPERPAGHIDLHCLPNIIGSPIRLRDRVVTSLIHRVPASRQLFRQAELVYRPRALHLFYGCRTYHGVEPAPGDGLRVIASINVLRRRV